MASAAKSSPMKTIAKIFGTPVKVDRFTWLPVVPLAAWGVLTFLAGRKNPQRTFFQRAAVGALAMPLVVGAEWGHNLAHMASGQLIGKPIDEVRIYGGLPRLVCTEQSDQSVIPRQHILRSLGGPLFNGLAVFLIALFRRVTRPDSLAQELADDALRVNTFIGSVALLPIPGIDGGPLLKWSLVLAGNSERQADESVRRLNWFLGGGLAIGMFTSLKQRRWSPALIQGMLGISALGIAAGWFKER
jgi:hypothetical protein